MSVSRHTTWLIRLASRLVPGSRRKTWREEWLAELAYATSATSRRAGTRRQTRMVLGALVDAATLRILSIEQGLAPRTLRRAVQGLGHDIRLALRGVTTAPGLTTAIIASLSIGLAASATGFSALQTLFFRPFPHVQHQENLRSLCVVRRDSCVASFDDYARLRAHLDAAEAVAASLPTRVVARLDGSAFTARAAVVSANYFDVLGVRPASGRFFSTFDDGAGMAQPVAVISHGLWQREMASRSDAAGRQVLVNGVAVRIVGVAPRGFVGVNPKTDGYTTGIWLPSSVAAIAVRDEMGRPQTASTMPPSYRMSLVARLRPGASAAHLEAQASSIASSFPLGLPSPAELAGGPDLRAVPRVSVHPVFLNDPAQAIPASLAFTGVPAIVLLIACVNAALLFVARATRRTGEWRVRLALGATRWRLVRQLLVEATGLAAISGLSGLLLTALLLRMQEQLIPLPVPVDLPVLLYTAGAIVCTVLIFGMGPSWSTATRTTIARGGLGRYRQRTRARSVLIGVQAALCLALLATGTQFLRALSRHLDVVGVSSPERLAVATFHLGPLALNGAKADDFYSALIESARHVRGVAEAGVSTNDYWGPQREGDFVDVLLEGETVGRPPWSGVSYIDGDLLDVLDVRLVRGRAFSEGEPTRGVRPILVNETFERTILDGRALGRRLRLRATGPNRGSEFDAEVIGIVAPPPGTGRADNEGQAHVYAAGSDSGALTRTLYLRTSDVPQTVSDLRRLVATVDDRVPVDVAGLDQRLSESRIDERWIARSTAVLGLLGLMLTAGGMFGVVTFVVAMRTPEIGVRLALGASPGSVISLIVRQAMTPVAIGLVGGTGLAIGLGLVVQSRLYGSEGIHPVALGAGAALLLTATGLASLIPARHVSRIDPNVALRSPE